MSTEPSTNSFTRPSLSWQKILERTFDDRETFCQKIQPAECQKNIPPELQEKCSEAFRECLKNTFARAYWNQTD